MRNRLALNIDLSGYDSAPEFVELIAAPDPATQRIVGRDGRAWLFDVAGQNAVQDNFRAGAVDLPIDWEHSTQHLAPKGEPAPAAAWIEAIEVREGGSLWGRVNWTERGAEQVTSKAYRYLSPVFDYEPDTGRIVQFVSAGLTNKPNLFLTALNQEETTMQRSALLAAAIAASLGLKEDATDDAVATALNALKKDKDDTATALNAQQAPSLERFVPRGDFDAAVARATNAETALKTRDKADHESAVDTAIKGALAAGKITPATEGYHRAACSDTAGLERFKAFVGTAPAVGGETGLDGKPVPSGATATALNADQREACRLLGMSEADYLKTVQGQASA